MAFDQYFNISQSKMSDQIGHFSVIPTELSIMILEYLGPEIFPMFMTCHFFQDMIRNYFKTQPNVNQFANHVAIQGDLKMLNWLKESGISFGNYFDHEKISKNGHLHVLQWIDTNVKKLKHCNIEFICEAAAKCGHLNILKWCCKEKDWNVRSLAIHSAIKAGQFNIIQWMMKKGVTLPNIFYKLAIAGGQLELVKWAYDRRHNGYEDICMIAIYNGQFEIFKWAVENGVSWDANQKDKYLEKTQKKPRAHVHMIVDTKSDNSRQEKIMIGKTKIREWINQNFSD